MIRLPTSATRTDQLLPYTSLPRSRRCVIVKLRRNGYFAARLGEHRPNCPDNAALRLALYRYNKLAHHAPLRKRSCFALASQAQMSPPHRAMDCSTRRNVDLESTRNSLIDVSLIVPHDWIVRKTQIGRAHV